MSKQQTIADLKPDKKNARRHNPRNIGMIADSIQEVGAARSIVIDEDNNILAGNGTVEAAAQAGITKMQIVDADGKTIIAVRRKGLTKKQKKRLAIADNRTAELAEWETDVLADFAEDGLLAGLFSESELESLLVDAPDIQAPEYGEPGGGKKTIMLNVPDEHRSLVESDLNRMREEYPGLSYYDA
jgi:hypothetical protein